MTVVFTSQCSYFRICKSLSECCCFERTHILHLFISTKHSCYLTENTPSRKNSIHFPPVILRLVAEAAIPLKVAQASCPLATSPRCSQARKNVWSLWRIYVCHRVAYQLEVPKHLWGKQPNHQQIYTWLMHHRLVGQDVSRTLDPIRWWYMSWHGAQWIGHWYCPMGGTIKASKVK